MRFAESAFCAAAAMCVVVTASCQHSVQNEDLDQNEGAGQMMALGHLPGGDGSEARDVSADGSVIIGTSRVVAGSKSEEIDSTRAFRWTKDGGMQGLGDLPGPPDSYFLARGVSADGLVIVGTRWTDTSKEPSQWTQQPFRWTNDGGMQGLGHLPEGEGRCWGYDVSADGSVVVGVSKGDKGRAFRWTKEGGMEALGDLPGGDDIPGGDSGSEARAVSADGSVIVGSSVSSNGLEAFRWTKDGGMQGLGALPGLRFRSRAYGVSADGSVIVGFSDSDKGTEAFRWTSDDGMEGLGDLPGGRFISVAHDVSADGSVIVGFSDSDKGREAFRWTREGGMEGLGDLPGGDFESWAHGVSADGAVIVGRARSDKGREAFRWTQ